MKILQNSCKNANIRLASKSSRYRFSKEQLKDGPGVGEYLLLIVPATTFGLGVWQVQRHYWKQDLIQNMNARQSAKPQKLPLNPHLMSDLEYQRFHVRGEFDHNHIVYLGPRSLIEKEDSQGGLFSTGDTIGFNIITPFKLENSEERILVNRGWVPRTKLTPDSRGETLPSGVVELTGVVRLTDKGGRFSPQNSEDSDLWPARDVEALAKYMNTLAIYIDADAESTVSNGPVGGQTRIKLPNDHVSYFVTW